MGLDGSLYSGDGLKPELRQGAERIYGPEQSTLYHNNDYWFQTLGMVDGDGNGYQDGSYNDSWVVANAGAPNNNQISSSFPGGYAGKCPQGTEWKKVTEGNQEIWQCSGEPDWKQAVFLPEIASGSNTIGMMVMPYNFRGTFSSANEDLRNNLDITSWKTAYDNVADNSATSNQDLDTMKVSCYPGETTPDYSSATEGEDYFNETVSISGTDVQNPIGVSGSVDMSGHTTYTCTWSYSTEGSDPSKVSNIGCVIELQKTETNCGGVNFNEVKNHFMDKEFSDGTVLKLDKKHSSEDVTSLMD